MRVIPSAFFAFAVLTVAVTPAIAQSGEPAGSPDAPDRPHAASVVRILGSRSMDALAPKGARGLGALVAIPEGKTARDLGLREVAPGVGSWRGSPESLLQFSDAHPGVFVETTPPLHLLLDKAGESTRAVSARARDHIDGTGVLIGVADTGIDTKHPDFKDANGKTRIAWVLDLSLPPRGKYPDLEEKYGIKSESGTIISGAVFSAEDIDTPPLRNFGMPQDEVGHGTHVSSIALGGGGGTPYVGIAPGAQLVFARVTGAASAGISNEDLARAVQFLFDRADAMKKPMVVNLSLGTDFGPHDGSMLWEKTVASYVGADKPGHALIAAAGNSGSVPETPIHQSVFVSEGTPMKVPIHAGTGANSGGIQVWLTMRSGADIHVGLDGPDGEWIAPVPPGDQRGKNTSGYRAGVINGGSVSGSPIPADSHGAAVLWQGEWPAGTYTITLEGHGTVDLYMQAVGDINPRYFGFLGAVREGTINLPATHPSVIAVGCTVNRSKWKSIAQTTIGVRVPALDPQGGFGLRCTGADCGGAIYQSREIEEGEVCWFSSAGPTVTGVPKPEISAPGGGVVASMSAQAPTDSESSIFSKTACPTRSGSAADGRCYQIDATHGLSMGTSMSAPVVSGAVALLFQKDPTLTQDKISVLLQAGAHRFRGKALFEDQGGPGELDMEGTLDALEQSNNPNLQLPSAEQSWMALSADYAAADGSTPLVALYELRTADGQHRADMFEIDRLVPYATLNGNALGTPKITRRGPGLYVAVLTVPPGSGGSSLTLGARFDGADIVAPKTIVVGSDIWTARYPSSAKGGCSFSPSSKVSFASLALSAFGSLLFGFAFARRSRRTG